MKKTVPDYIIDVLIPFLVYLFVNLFVQAGYTVYALISQFGILGSGNVGYKESISFVENMEQLVSSNTLTVTFISVAIACPIFLRMYKKQVGSLKFTGKTKNLYIVAILGMLASAGISKLVMLFPIDGILGNYTETASKVMESNIGLQIITLIILGPIMEELLFRGVIYNRLKEFNDKTIAAYISAIIFGIYHFNLVQGIYTFILAIFLVYMYEKFETIWAPIVMHMAANAIAVIVEHVELCNIINKYWFVKVPVMLIELAAFYMIFYHMFYKKQEDRQEDGQEV